jgi:hypothetical protein
VGLGRPHCPRRIGRLPVLELVPYRLHSPGDQPGPRREAAPVGCTDGRWRREATMGARVGFGTGLRRPVLGRKKREKRNKRAAHFHMGPHVMSVVG